jgi:hypothetical protein
MRFYIGSMIGQGEEAQGEKVKVRVRHSNVILLEVRPLVELAVLL